MRLPTCLAVVSLGFVACAPQPKPTSTTPATPGSAVILPSPVQGEPVPKSEPAASSAPSASASAPTQ